MSLATINFLDRLRQAGMTVKRVGDGKFVCQCPAHQDRSPSLSVADTADSLLIHCHAGCPTTDVIAALGLEFKDLYDGTREDYQPPHAFYRLERKREEKQRDEVRIKQTVVALAQAKFERGEPLSPRDRDDYLIAIGWLQSRGVESDPAVLLRTLYHDLGLRDPADKSGDLVAK
jgi:hypothetical protein